MGKLIKEEDLSPDLIISSTAKRSKKTAQAVAEYSGYDGKIDLDPSLYSADPESYLKALSRVRDKFNMVLVVGHNPALENLVNMLTSKSEPMPTCALAQIDLGVKYWDDLGKKIDGAVIKVWRPNELEES